MSTYNIAGSITVRAKKNGTRRDVESDMEAALMDACLYLSGKYAGLRFDTSSLAINQRLSEQVRA